MGGGYSVNSTDAKSIASRSGDARVELGGDINLGPGAGSGLKFSTPVMIGLAVAAVVIVWIFKRK